jgi:molybdate transport system regulatory protein
MTPALRIRIVFGEAGRIGPGKMRLLEEIAAHGSISAAGRAMDMSYRRAWLLVEALNQTFAEPLVATQHGGPRGGGAFLTDLGRHVLGQYRAIEAEAASAAAHRLADLESRLARD